MAFLNKTGFVLSGGGMRGMAHIGVIKALREYDIEVDYVSGTSIGAVVGAMYAADMPTDDMLAFFKSISIFSFRNYTFNKPGIIDSEKFRKKLLDIFPEDSFENLPKKLTVSVTNLMNGKNRLIESGSLTTALLCSAAIPGVFSPVQVEDVYYCDGGLTNNYPIEILHSRCQFIIGSYVNPLLELKEASSLKNTLSLFDRALVIATYRMESPSFNLADIFILPEELRRSSTLSLKHIDETYEIGYREAVKQIKKYLENQKA